MTSRRNLISLDLDDVDDDSPLLPSTTVGFDRELEASVGQGEAREPEHTSSYQKIDGSKKSIFDLSDLETEEIDLSKAAQQRLRASAQSDGFRNSRPVRYGRPPTGRTAALHVRIRPELLQALNKYRSETGVGANIAVEQAICALLRLNFETLNKEDGSEGN